MSTSQAQAAPGVGGVRRPAPPSPPSSLARLPPDMTASSTAVRNVTVIVAMEQEVQPLVQLFNLCRLQDTFLPGAPFVAWEGAVGQLMLRVVWCGRDPRFGGVNNVATTAAAVCTYASIAAFGRPELVISAGTAGGFQAAGAAVGDCFLSSKCIFHSRRIPSDEGALLEEYGFGHFRSPPLGELASRAGLKVGVVSTSDSLDCTAQDLELMRSEGAAVKEMEAAAVAWVCQTLGIPFLALKAITDIVDGEAATRTQFESNLHTASAALQKKLAEVLSLLENTSLREWATAGVGSGGSGGSSSTAPAEPERPSSISHSERHSVGSSHGSTPSGAAVLSLGLAAGLVLGAVLGSGLLHRHNVSGMFRPRT
jgi:5'-methylthioadenosine nucleosidase